MAYKFTEKVANRDQTLGIAKYYKKNLDRSSVNSQTTVGNITFPKATVVIKTLHTFT